MIDPTYVSQAAAWLVVWAAGGYSARAWLAGKAFEQRVSAAPRRQHEHVPAGARGGDRVR